MLMRIRLNHHLIDIDQALSHFIDSRKNTFEAYVKQKIEAKEKISKNYL
jgi:hypothetical protein